MIPDAVRKAGPYNGDGTTVNFPFAFKVFDETDVAVLQTDTSGAETQLDSGYTVALNADQDTSPGGVVTFAGAPDSGFKITIVGALAAYQPMQLTNAGGFFPTVLNDSADRAIILIQQLYEASNRTVKSPASDGLEAPTLPAVEARKGGVLGFSDDTGNFVVFPKTTFTGPVGPRGPNGYSAATLAQLKAAPTTDGPLMSAPNGNDPAPFIFLTEGAPYTADDTNIVKSDDIDLSVGAWVRQTLANIPLAPTDDGAQPIPADQILSALGKHAATYGAVADGDTDQTDNRTALSKLLLASAGGIAILPGSYAVSAGAVNPNPDASDPDPSALYVTADNTTLDGLGHGKLIGTDADKGLINVKGLSVSAPPTNITVQNFRNVVQAYGNPVASGLNDDYFAFRYEGAHACKFLNNHIAQCELGFTDEYAQTAPGTRYYSFDAATDVSTSTDSITINKDAVGAATTHNFSTGDLVALNPSGTVAWGSGATMPTGLYAPYRYYAIVVDTTTIKLAASYDDAIAGTAVDLTAAGSGTVVVTKTNRQSRYNILNNFVVEKCGYLGVQLGGCAYGQYSNIIVNGLASDGHSRGGQHGVRLDGFFMALTEFNQVNAIISRMANGVSLQSFSEHNVVRAVANDCQNGVMTTRPVDAIAAAKHNEIYVNANRCDYGIYEDGNVSNIYIVDILNPKTRGIYTTNGGGIAGLATGNIYRGRVRQSIPGSAQRLVELSSAKDTLDLLIEGSGSTSVDTSFGLLMQAAATDLRGSVHISKCQIGCQLSGTGSHLFLKADNCGTALSIPGSNHVVFCDIDGNVSITGNNNTIIGRVSGTVTNTGTGNRVQVSAQSGWTAGTGTANKGAFATYAGATMSATYAQAEAQATNDAVKAVSQRVLALEQALRAAGLIV